MSYQVYSAGQTPADIIKAAFTEDYSMSLVGDDRDVMTRAINMGIDSHLEAFTGSSFNDDGHRLDCEVSPEDMPVLLRRLAEDIGADEVEDTTGDAAYSLRSGILSTAGIEEV